MCIRYSYNEANKFEAHQETQDYEIAHCVKQIVSEVISNPNSNSNANPSGVPTSGMGGNRITLALALALDFDDKGFAYEIVLETINEEVRYAAIARTFIYIYIYIYDIIIIIDVCC